MKFEHYKLNLAQSLPLEVKVMKAESKIIDAIMEYGIDSLYISNSGGKDSDVLIDICDNVCEKLELRKIPKVYCDTGLEYKSVREKGLKSDVVIKPKMTFIEILKKYGYPVISKEQSQFIYEYRHTNSDDLRNTRLNGNKSGRGKISKINFPLVDSDFEISHMCCYYMKKKPFIKYEKETGRIGILGLLADESQLRKQGYIKNGCNAFAKKRPQSNPLSPFTYQDILQYIKMRDIKIAEIYGEIITVSFFPSVLDLTGVDRTGCVFCMYGSHKNNFAKFEILKKQEPKKYDYCMKGGKYLNGKWIPNNGLGMEKVINDIKKIRGNK